MIPEEILKEKKSFAIVGASNEMMKYGYELVCVFQDYGFKIFPINPKYDEIEGIKCYPSLKELPERPDVVLTALAPKNTLNVISDVKEIGVDKIWFPPNCYDDNSIKKAEELKLDYVCNVCPIGILRRIFSQS
ncbi:CoA-binding protein [Melioribacteraceae bacterium 4301-Me]|uniref:CoA-binding protein n=1 Tax=Pyranulibacter aquaticus TaxID=3163344 RepID=UPI003598ABDF